MAVFKLRGPGAPPRAELTWFSALAFVVIAFALAAGWQLLRVRFG